MQELPVVFTGFKQSFNMPRTAFAIGHQVAEFFMFFEPVTVERMILEVGNDNIFFFRGGEKIGGGK